MKDTIGEKIKTYRKLRGLSQEKLAELCEMSTNSISNIERGKTKVKIENLKKIARVLNIELIDFISSNIKQDEKYLNVIIELAKPLSAEKQKQIIDIIKTFT